MTNIETLAEFRKGLNRCGFDYAAELLGVETEHLRGPNATHVLIHESALCYMTQHGDDSYWTATASCDECTSTFNAVSAHLYFNHFVSECGIDWNESSLCTLLKEFAEWSRIEWASADEMLFSLLHVEPRCRTPQMRRDIAFLEWFCKTWESVQNT